MHHDHSDTDPYEAVRNLKAIQLCILFNDISYLVSSCFELFFLLCSLEGEGSQEQTKR